MNTNRSKLFEGKDKNAGGGGAGGGLFNGQRPITRNTPGIIGYDPNTTTVIAFLENTFYPPVAPIAALSVENPTREVGDSKNYILDWAVTEQSHAITGIDVNGTAIAPTGNNQAGNQAGAVVTASGTYIFNMSATDGTLTGYASAQLQYLARMFWGTTPKNGGTAPILDADILALQGSELRTDFKKSFSQFGGGGQYLIFAFPTVFGTPQFIINGLNNTAFTCVRAASPFINQFGAMVLMDVWVSNNLYNSPLDSVVLQ